MAIIWTEYENRALLPAYETEVGDVCAIVYHPRRQPTRWHVMVWDKDTDPDQYTIECTEAIINHEGWDTPEQAQKHAEFFLLNQN